jgi:hypothetical protein
VLSQEENGHLFNMDDAVTAGEYVVQQGLEGLVNAIPESRFRQQPPEQVFEEIYREAAVQPLAIDESELKPVFTGEAAVHPSGHWDHLKYAMPTYKPGVRVRFSMPFRGTASLLRLRPYRGFPISPRGSAKKTSETSGAIEFVGLGVGDDAADQIRTSIEREIHNIRTCIAEQTPILEAFNAKLPDLIRSAIAKRRRRLDIAAEFTPVVVERPDPKPTSEPLEPRRRPPLVEKRPREITQALYEDLLGIIRNYGRGFEQTPGAMSKLDEEEIRDHLLNNVNTHSLAAPLTAETHRRRGHADMVWTSLDFKGFVGECKIWNGPRSLHVAIKQLFLYALTRDAKCAILLFNMNRKRFKRLLAVILRELQKNSQVTSEVTVVDEDGEWMLKVASPNDRDHIVDLRVFLFDYCVR